MSLPLVMPTNKELMVVWGVTEALWVAPRPASNTVK